MRSNPRKRYKISVPTHHPERLLGHYSSLVSVTLVEIDRSFSVPRVKQKNQTGSFLYNLLRIEVTS